MSEPLQLQRQRVDSREVLDVNSHLQKVVLMAIFLTVSHQALAQRLVIVNGERLNANEIGQLERLACTAVPDGNYWIDMNTGAWGYAGNSYLMGYVGDACQRHRSLSERGLLYRPGEILSE